MFLLLFVYVCVSSCWSLDASMCVCLRLFWSFVLVFCLFCLFIFVLLYVFVFCLFVFVLIVVVCFCLFCVCDVMFVVVWFLYLFVNWANSLLRWEFRTEIKLSMRAMLPIAMAGTRRNNQWKKRIGLLWGRARGGCVGLLLCLVCVCLCGFVCFGLVCVCDCSCLFVFLGGVMFVNDFVCVCICCFFIGCFLWLCYVCVFGFCLFVLVSVL